jgi:hypothetical protein
MISPRIPPTTQLGRYSLPSSLIRLLKTYPTPNNRHNATKEITALLLT